MDGPGTPWLERFHGIYRAEGLDFARERFSQAFYRSDDELASRFSLRGLSLAETLELQVQCVLEILAPEKIGLKSRLAGLFLEECRRHFRGNRPILERLSRRHGLGIVSNFYGNLRSVLDSEGLLSFFQCVADSGALGMEKPQPGIFLEALKGLKAAPEETFMVGDSVARDMRGAENLGLKHVLLSPSKKTRCCPQGLRIERLDELEAVLP